MEETSTRVANLHDVAKLLSERDRSFADSLITQFVAKGDLSEKQWHWVGELTKRGKAARAPFAPLPPKPVAKPPVQAVAFSKIAELFAKAGQRAVVVFRTGTGVDFRLSVAGERSANPGHINVTDTARGFEDRVWFGRITPQGGWVSSRKIDAAELRAVEAALAEFNADPAAAAASYGHAVGSCCFCGRELTDERSVSVGYGPICADRFGLSWGETNGPSRQELKAEAVQAVSDAEIPF